MNDDFKVSLKYRIDWSEMDEFSHINNVMFMKYIQAGRVNYWQETGIYKLFKEKNIGPMVLSLNCRFLKPLYFPGEVIIRTRCSEIKNTSFVFEHRLYNEKNECVAEGTDVLVMYDFNKEEKYPFPEDLRAAIEKLEGEKF